MMRLENKRLLALGVSTVLSVAVLLLFLHLRPQRRSVEEVDISRGLDQLLEDRYRGAVDLAEFVDDHGDPTLVREPVSEELAELFFPALTRNPARFVYDPEVYLRNRARLKVRRRSREHPAGGWDVVTNDLGFRGTRDLRRDRPDLRILVTGDSHIEGVLPAEENLTNVLEADLAGRHPDLEVEVLNAGKGAYSFFNYLGVIEKYSELEPEVFVMVVYGGNDFTDVLPMARYFYRLPPQDHDPHLKQQLQKLARRNHGYVPQWLRQIVHFAHHPEDRELALHVAEAAALEVARTCRRSGVEFVCVYLPPSMAVQPRLLELDMAKIGRLLEISEEDLAIPGELADAFLAAIEARGILTIDLRAEFRAAPELLYWRSDHHLNTSGHRRVAETLVSVIEAGG